MLTTKKIVVPTNLINLAKKTALIPVGIVCAHHESTMICAKQAYEFIGSPEGELALAQSVIFLATAPKSNSAYKAFSSANAAARETGSLMPPKHILNAPTHLMKNLGYGAGYSYDHDRKDAFSGQDYFPEGVDRKTFYTPSSRGYEQKIEKRLQYWSVLRAKKRQESESED